ncbi:unnamed protein product [Closterium sp. NIES-54]
MMHSMAQVLTRDCSARRTASSAPVTTSNSNRCTIAAACALLHHMAAAAGALSPCHCWRPVAPALPAAPCA